MNAVSAHHSSHRARGMTLVELLIAFAILMSGLVCIFALLMAGAASHRRAIKETEATMIASSILADMRGELAVGVIPASDGLTYQEVKDHEGYKSNCVIFPIDRRKGDNREFFVRLRIRWSEKGDNQFIEFNTVMLAGGEKPAKKDK